MRPKKQIYLIDANEERRSIRKFLLTNKGFKVHTEAPESCNLVVACWPVNDDALKVARTLGAPLLLLVDHLDTKAPLTFGADRLLYGSSCCPWEIVDTVTILTTLKRGPKPRPVVSAPLPAQKAVEVAC
jgi:hypothetical protein